MRETHSSDNRLTQTKRDQLKDRPIQLIQIEGDKFSLNEDALNILQNIDDDITVVSLVGKDSPDKTFLQSLLLDKFARGGVNYS
jgi:hypothetical protein